MSAVIIAGVILWGSASEAAAPGRPLIRPGVDLVEAALRASGYATKAEFRRARADFERHTGPIVENLKRVRDPERQARLLLKSLHQKGGLLGQYDARATTLRDILERRAFNCVSASVLYNLVAHRLSLPVAAQLLPTHARSMLSLERGETLVSIVVETTSQGGFDPDPTEQAMILAAVATVDDRPGRSLVSESGAIVDTGVLISTIYVNRASIAQEAGDLEAAEQLFALAQRKAPEPSMQRVLRDQRAALLSQLAADDITVGGAELLERAFRSLRAAVALSPSSPEIIATVQHNLRALAERMLNERTHAKDEQALLSISRRIQRLMAAPSARAGVRALALTQLASLRTEANDLEGAIRHLERGLAQPLSPRDEALRLSVRSSLLAILRLAALRKAEAGDFAGSQHYLDRADAMPLDEASRAALVRDRRRMFHLIGEHRLDKRDYEGAARVYRTALRRNPDDHSSRHNLVVALERLAMPHVDAGECAQAQPYIAEIRRVDARASFPAQAELRCVLFQARRRLTAGDFAGAVRLIRSGDPSDQAVRQNLSVALLRWTAALAQRGRCSEARIRASEAKAVPHTRPSAVTEALGHCR